MTSKALRNQRPVARGGVWAEIDAKQLAHDAALANAKAVGEDLDFRIECSDQTGKWFAQPKGKPAVYRIGPFDDARQLIVAMRERAAAR